MLDSKIAIVESSLGCPTQSIKMNVKLILSDFDGTLTLGAELTPRFFQILDLLNTNELPLLIVTGRSQAWGHFLLSHFPLEAIITEGGGVISRKENDVISDEFLISHEQRQELQKLTSKLRQKFSPLVLSADSQGRQTDRAIELRDLKKHNLKHEVESFLKAEGANFSSSNVHLNFWIGDIQKYKATEFYLKKDYPDLKLEDCIFFGDSLNDESLFERLPYTVGVSNINHILDQFKYRPHKVLEGVDKAGPEGVYSYLKEVLEK